jgi:two-component system sensor histidine kinase/response regulator
VVGAFVVANAVVSLKCAQSMVRNESELQRSRHLLGAAEETLSTAKDAETGVRGYVITGDKSYLEPYSAASEGIDDSIDALERHSSDDLVQQRLVSELRVLLRAKRDLLEATVRARETSRAAATRLTVTNEGKALMDHIRRAISEISANVVRKMESQSLAAARSGLQLKAAIVVGMAAGLLLVAGIAYCLQLDYRTKRDAEAALVESNRFAYATLDALHAHIAILDETGAIIATNRAWREFGAANSSGNKCRDSGNYLSVCESATGPAAEQAATVAAGIRAVLSGDQSTFEMEYPCVSPHEKRWFIVRISRFAGDGPVRLVVAHEDISSAKKAHCAAEIADIGMRTAHEALSRSEARYRALTDAMPQMVWTTLPSGYADYFNQGWIKFTGRSFTQNLGDGWLEVVHPDDRTSTYERWTTAVETNADYTAEYRVRRGCDGAYRWHLARGVAVREPGGEIIKWFGTTTDIDDQKRMAEELRAAKEAADEASRAKSDFLANMSHEIRTPMNGVLGMTELLLESNLNDEQREFVELVKSSGEALMTVINDILDFSKIEARRMELDPVSFQLHDLLQNTLKPLALRAHRKNLELTCDISRDVPEWVVGDPNRLRQVLINIVGNAIKFTDAGEVVLQARLVSERENDLGIAFAVVDTGIGIHAEKQDSIFDPFSQADNSLSRKYGGTGLGLSISSQLVALMGGTLSVRSKYGEGSKFSFEARLTRSETAVAPPLPEDSIDLTGLRTLVVDDNATNLRVMDEMLRHWNARPTTRSTGEAALIELTRAARAGAPYQLVAVDSIMPEMDGFALVEQMQGLSMSAIPAIMMLTSADRRGDVARCRAMGIDAYLVKPIKGAELFQAIARCVYKAPIDRREGRVATCDVESNPAERSESVTPLKVLLAEDNLVNQRVAHGILVGRGHTVVMVDDGEEAIEAVANGAFDVVLMDVQMPNLDGLQATARIREMEAATGGHTLIVAMTAHAHPGDEQHCLDSGMDGYLSKPLVARELLAMIDRLVVAQRQQPDNDRASQTVEATCELDAAADDSSPVDFAEVATRVDNDLSLLQNVIDLFIADSPKYLDEIEDAAARNDFHGVARASHALKGAMLNVGAGPAARAAGCLEDHARSMSTEEIQDSVESLKSEMDVVLTALSAYSPNVNA